MCPTTLFPFLGFFSVGMGVLGLVLSLNPQCEYPERRLVAPIVKMFVWSCVGLFFFVLGGTIPWINPTMTISICPESLLLSPLFVYAIKYAVTHYYAPPYWRWRLSSWAGHNRFGLLDFAKLHSGPGERACFKVVLQDASGKERQAEVTLGSRAGFNLNHVDLVWLD
jgi:hypothetical protein